MAIFEQSLALWANIHPRSCIVKSSLRLTIDAAKRGTHMISAGFGKRLRRAGMAIPAMKRRLTHDRCRVET